jgi:predicted 3-demethylubiquinone-9 3-methyltransferase (glyoxalase superfamily)
LLIVIAAAGCADDSASTGSESASQGGKSAAKKKGAQSGKPAAPARPEMTSGQKNALQAAESYVDTMPFSKAGLIQQLSSSAGDGYSKADATFAANRVGADWNEEAVEAARNYLDTMPMSKDALIQQLSSAAGDKFTRAQAQHAASKVY